MTIKHTGGCHCGRVRFEVLAPARIRVSECNCPICSKSGFLHLVVSAGRFTLLSGREVLSKSIGVNALLYRVSVLADVSRAQREPARPNPDELRTEVAKAFDLPRHAVLDRRHAQAYRCAVYLLRRIVNELIAKVARRAGISAPRVSQIQAEAESAKPQGPLRMLLDCYKVKR